MRISNFLKKFFKIIPVRITWKQAIKILDIREIDVPTFSKFKELMSFYVGIETIEVSDTVSNTYGYFLDDITDVLKNKQEKLNNLKERLKEIRREQIEDQIKNLQKLLETHYKE